MQSIQKLFGALEEFCRGRPAQLAEEIFQVRAWLTTHKDKRPSGYMNHPAYFAAYSAYHLPLHLPELYWILEQNVTRLKLKAPQTILDLGCGPGTLSLSYLLWSQARGFVPPKNIELVDFSKRALDGARYLIDSINDPTKTKVNARRVHLHDKKGLSPRVKADWIFLGHVMNEWGSGPRSREMKREFVLKVMENHLNPGGYLFIVEPPLREPTLDLMKLRDDLAQEFDVNPVVAPCPGGVAFCPMLRNHMGWCYAQPPRTWATEKNLAPWDREIRRVLSIRLEDPGFSYLVLRSLESPELELPAHAIAITDGDARRTMICTKQGAKEGRVTFRGDYLVKTQSSVVGAGSAAKPPK